MDWVVERYVLKSLQRTEDKRGNVDSIGVLCLNSIRYQADLEVLGEHPSVHLITLPVEVQTNVNALWLSDIRRKISHRDFITMGDKFISDARDGLNKYLQRILPRICTKA